jgi:hypothetical protein
MALPSLPRDWDRRAAGCGPGLVLQTTGESDRAEAHADRIERFLRDRGLPVRHDRLATADAARSRAASPGALFSVLLDGTRLGGMELSGGDILQAVLHGVDA